MNIFISLVDIEIFINKWNDGFKPTLQYKPMGASNKIFLTEIIIIVFDWDRIGSIHNCQQNILSQTPIFTSTFLQLDNLHWKWRKKRAKCWKGTKFFFFPPAPPPPKEYALYIWLNIDNYGKKNKNKKQYYGWAPYCFKHKCMWKFRQLCPIQMSMPVICLNETCKTEICVVPVWYSESLDAPIHRENIGDMAVVEPETWRVYQHCPVVSVAGLEETLHLLLKHINNN